MKIKADLHNHFSTLENIGRKIFDKAINTAQKNLDARGILGVINAQDKGIGRYETFLKQGGGTRIEDLDNAFYVPDNDIYVIKGQEVFTEEGHILVLGLNYRTKLKNYRALGDSLKEAQDNNGIIIADHPWFLDGIFSKGNVGSKFLAQLDGIEVHNSEAWIPIPGYVRANKKAQEFYNKIRDDYDIGAISTSDGHSIKEIGTSYTILEAPDFSSPEKLVETLRKSIREHKDFSNDRQTNSYLGALNHGSKGAVLRFASAVGLIGRIN
jgi:hypothetical protein